MTTIVFEDGVLATDSFVSTEDKYDRTVFVFREKVFKDKENRFVFANYGDQPWVNKEAKFQALMDKICVELKKCEAKKDNDKRKAEVKSIRFNLETEGISSFKGFLVTKKKAYEILTDDSSNLRFSEMQAGYEGTDVALLSYFINMGYRAIDALPIIAKHTQATGGEIHYYHQSKLKAL